MPYGAVDGDLATSWSDREGIVKETLFLEGKRLESSSSQMKSAEKGLGKLVRWSASSPTAVDYRTPAKHSPWHQELSF